MSVLVAFVIGGIELVRVLGIGFNLSSGFWNWLENLDFETMGFAIVAIFVATSASAYCVWRSKKYDQDPSPLIRPLEGST